MRGVASVALGRLAEETSASAHNDFPSGTWPPFGESWAGAAERQPALKKIEKTPRAKISANFANLHCKTLLGGEKLFLLQVNTSGRPRPL